jgi:NO-binding membrane sensor protein with MHYT domain
VYDSYFQLNALPADRLIGVYDIRLVFLSFIVAVFASYIALDFTGRLRENNTTRSRILWLIGGAVAMGAGIWSMHFIGMLSLTVPGITLQYDTFWTVFSLVVAILASGFALYILQVSVINIIHLVSGGVLLGLAIACMHYTGMAGLLISLNIRYLPGIFILSILIAIVASEAAIWFALKSTMVVLRWQHRIKIISAIIMGFAICGMHYTSMAASVFTPLCVAVSNNTQTLDPAILSVIIAAVTFVILGLASFTSSYKEAINQEKMELARELGMSEIATSVLHNVGNVLNSVNVSTGAITEKISSSKLTGLEELAQLLNEHKADLVEFITQDARGIHVPAYTNQLAVCWRKEQHYVLNEIACLSKNVALIKDIISTQQTLTKTTGLKQIISINDLIDEVLLISGVNLVKEIDVEKQYSKIQGINVDKVKLLQILDNLLRNAKESLLDSSNKTISIKTEVINQEKISIKIADNGKGILSENVNKIFIFGFTTKKEGHGFGLHTSALAARELGGEIHVESEGINKGATFSLTIPYSRPKSIINL